MSDKAKGKKDKKEKADKKKDDKKENAEDKKEEGGEEAAGEEVKGGNLGPQDLPLGEELFGVCHICATFNDTFIHVTDLSGRETFSSFFLSSFPFLSFFPLALSLILYLK